jgi:hypothetical protein
VPQVREVEVQKALAWEDWAKIVMRGFKDYPALIVESPIEEMTKAMIESGFLQPPSPNLLKRELFPYLSAIERTLSVPTYSRKKEEMTKPVAERSAMIQIWEHRPDAQDKIEHDASHEVEVHKQKPVIEHE